MLSKAPAVLGMKSVLMKLMLLVIQVNLAATERREETTEITAGFGTPADPLPTHTVASSLLLKASPLNSSQRMKCCFFSIKSSGLDGTKNTEKITPQKITAGIIAGKSLTNDPTRSNNRAKILKMISALMELHKTLNHSLSSHITLIPHANSRNPRRKSKLIPALESEVKATAATLSGLETTTSSSSSGLVALSMPGRNFRKSPPPQTKKSNKRVCFWKYCSQN